MKLEDYELEKCLGKGAFGEVYLTSKKGDVIVLYAQWESTNPSVTASLFTDGSFGLILGGVVAGGAIAAIVIFLVYKSKKRRV